MFISYRTRKEQRTARKIEAHLVQLPFSSEAHRIQVHIDENGVNIAYLTTNTQFRFLQTHFDMTLKGVVCDIVGFGVASEDRGKGYGRKLYQTIEDYARVQGCKRIVVSPSGQGTTFWPHMGFNEPCSVGLQKRLNQ